MGLVQEAEGQLSSDAGEGYEMRVLATGNPQELFHALAQAVNNAPSDAEENPKESGDEHPQVSST